MKTSRVYKITGASMLALGLTIAPLSSSLVQAQDSEPATEATAEGETAGQNFEESEEALERAGQEAVEGIEAAGEAAQQDVQEAAQDASQAAQDASQAAQQTATDAAEEAAAAAERAELAAENAAENIQDSFNWGWLGLLGLIGLFGLAGGNKRQVEVEERHHASTTPTSNYR